MHIVGHDVRHEAMAVHRRLGYVPQQLSIETGPTGRENVTWFARLFDVPRAERRPIPDAVLAMVDLTDVAGRLASTYSGGIVRRLELTQALVNRRAVLRDHYGMTVLPTTHYMEEEDALCDGVALMHLGKLRAVGCAMSTARAAPSASADADAGARELRGPHLLPSRTFTFCVVEVQKLRHDRTELLTRAVQPIFWLVVFGETLSKIRAIPTGNVPYLDYLAPGINAQSALLISIFYGIQIIGSAMPASGPRCSSRRHLGPRW